MKRMLAPLVCLLVLSIPAFADGPGPARKMTDAESAGFTKVRAAVQEALPKAPTGYDFSLKYQSDFDEGTIPQALPANRMFRMAYVAHYTRNGTQDGQQMMGSFMDRAKGTPEQQAKMAELEAKEAALTKARDEAKNAEAKSKARAELKAVRAESNKLSDEIMAGYQEWVSSGGATNAMQDFDKSLPAKELTVKVWINDDVSLNQKAAPITLEGGLPAFEQAEGCDGIAAHCITVFLGPFEKLNKNAGYTTFKIRETDLGVPTRARGMVVIFSGPEDKPEGVRDLVRRTDWTKLKALLP